MAESPVSQETEARLLDCLAHHPGVERAAVTSWVDQDGASQPIAYVVPAAAGTPAAAMSEGHLDRWENLWSMLYRQDDAPDPEFDIRGWNSSYTRKPLPAEEMRDWVDETVRTIEDLGAESILEIGCGSGLLLHRLVPRCRRYVATDFSAAAVERLQRQVRDGALPDFVEARQVPAHSLGDIPGDFDLVIVNSVIQYFPTAAYLDDVIEQAVTLTRPGGGVFVGDVYHLALREAMQTSIVVEQAAPDAPTEVLRSRVLHRIASQTELLIDPAYFAQLVARTAGLSGVRALPKFGAYDNEMTRFRYDAVLEVGGDAGSPVDVPWHDWQSEGLDAGSLQALLAGDGDGFGVSRIPNSRVTPWLRRWSELNGGMPGEDGEAMSPEDLRATTAGSSYRLHLSCLSSRPDTSIDAAWLPATGSDARPRFPQPASTSAAASSNDPLWARATEGLVRELRRHLRDALGQTGPMTLVCVDEIPPTPDPIPDSLEATA
ncbi:MAG: hypothetical protein QOJ69_1555 [Actinomycetota bacterium]|jgi:SAM-dependent methyltransferase|nr:hypothetical protein [Actinomycetota bacterium]